MILAVYRPPASFPHCLMNVVRCGCGANSCGTTVIVYIIVVGDCHAPIWCQGICNHHDNVGWLVWCFSSRQCPNVILSEYISCALSADQSVINYMNLTKHCLRHPNKTASKIEPATLKCVESLIHSILHDEISLLKYKSWRPSVRWRLSCVATVMQR